MINYFIKEVKGEFEIKDKNSNKVFGKFNNKKTAEDKIKRLREKDKQSIKTPTKNGPKIPFDVSSPIPSTLEVKTIINEGLKDNRNIKKDKLKKKFRDLNSI